MSLMYILFAILLSAAYLIKTQDDRTEQRLAIVYFAFAYSMPGVIWQLYQPATNPAYFAIQGSSSFLLILLYHSLYMTPALFACALMEVGQIMLCIAGTLGVKWTVSYYVELVGAVNYLALAILAWSYADGNGFRGRRIYTRMVNPSWFGIASIDRIVARYSEKVKMPW